VPSGFRESCTEVPNPPDEAPGSVNCRPGTGAAFVHYREYVNSTGMKLAFDTDIDAYFGGDPPLRDECGDDGTGLDTWEYGRRLCNISPDHRASVVWTDNRLSIYAWARRGDDDFGALLEAFEDGTFGPTP
jgi:hypothetical protein